MTKTITLFPGITLRCFPDDRFKQAGLSIQLVRPMCRAEAAMNALLPAVLLRGTASAPDIRAITRRLDDLYGAAVGATVRRIGDYQTTGLSCGFIEDRLALSGDRVMEPMMAFLKELLLYPALEKGVFRTDFVEGEKKNLTAVLESEINDKRIYAGSQLLRHMCSADSFGIPRLGDKEDVAKITPEGLYRHYRRILKESRIDIFYVGSAEPDTVAGLMKDVFGDLERDYVNLPAQTPFCDGGKGEHTERMEVSQGKLCMGFTTPVTIGDPLFVPMQLLNLIFGAGMTSKLFMNVRERLSLCYDIGSGYHGSKGILTVSAGIDCAKVGEVRAEIMNQLAACQEGRISEAELAAAKQAILSGMRAVHDSTGAIENFYATAALSGLSLMPDAYMAAAQSATLDDVVAAAKSLQLHTVYFLEGVSR